VPISISSSRALIGTWPLVASSVVPLIYSPRSSVTMALTCRGLAALALLISSAVAQNSTNSTNSVIDTNYDVLTYVNQLIGSNNGGNVFPGATLPFGKYL
jgi:putative alpha-1,2-mannosidase